MGERKEELKEGTRLKCRSQKLAPVLASANNFFELRLLWKMVGSKLRFRVSGLC